MNAVFCSSSLRSFRVILSIPAVRLPGLLNTFSKAFLSQSSRQIKWTNPRTGVPVVFALFGRNSLVSCEYHPYVYRMFLWDCPIGVRTRKFLSNPCSPSPRDGSSPSLTTMAAPTPFHHINHSRSSPYAGRVVGSPTFATKPFTPKFRFLLYARPMSPDIVVIVRWLIPHEPLSVRLSNWTFHCFPCDTTVTR